MLLTEPTSEMLENWMKLWKENKDKIKPDRKSGEDVLNYLKEKYVLIPTEKTGGESIVKQVEDEIKNNEYSAWRLPVGKKPEVKAFIVEKKGKGRELYENQDEMFKGLEIIAAVDLVTGYCHIENSSLLYDEIIAFQGLDEIDITNYFLVAQYIQCRQEFGMEIN